jgi:hypothetical protein
VFLACKYSEQSHKPPAAEISAEARFTYRIVLCYNLVIKQKVLVGID